MYFTNKISNLAQLGGIETSVLDNGPARGSRIAWFNTGTGLRFKVMIDRAMDIADTAYKQYNTAWISHLGATSAQPSSNRGSDWIKTFGGGLMVTCGLDHVGAAEIDDFGERGMHGPISQCAAEIESIIQPDFRTGKMDMSITGRMRQSQPLGPQLELQRTISARIGESVIRIHDVVSNCGNIATPHMILYHFNFGWPLLDEGTEVFWNNQRAYECPPPLSEHRGNAEEVQFVDIEPNDSGMCRAGLYNPDINLELSLQFRKAQLPWLTNWRHWGEGEYVTGLEPGTNPPIGQSRARAEKQLILLQPGESKEYHLEVYLGERSKNTSYQS